jgi:hypothetical protein
VTLIQVVEAGQRLLVDRVELALLQAQQSFKRAIVDVALVILAGAALIGAWVALNYALVELLTRSASRLIALLSIAALHATVGVALLARRARSAR